MIHATPHVLEDRCQVSILERENPRLLRKLVNCKLGKTQNKSSIHFCGLAWVDHETAFVFLPRKSMSVSESENLATAQLTMRTLARFGQDTTDRTGIAAGAEGQTGLLATILELAVDFAQHGIFAERLRHATRNAGKPNWVRTVVREQALVGADGSVGYPTIRTSRSRDSHDSLLARVQATVMLEIAYCHGWWLEGVRARMGELRGYDTPSMPRFMWPKRLRLLLPELYNARVVNLVNMLVSYLENDRDRVSGELYFGVENFHSVWEYMLRHTLVGVESGWNSRLPRPAYHRYDGHKEIQERGLQTDIIIRDESGLRIVDAKYYDATSIGNSPGVADIIKQFFYEIAVSSIAKDESVSGCFVFPALKEGDGPFIRVDMHHRDGSPAISFPVIECHYMNLKAIMTAFVLGKKIVFPAASPA